MITLVERRGESTDSLREAVASLSRKKRNGFGDGFQSQPLEPITKFLPGRAHRRSVSALFIPCERLRKAGHPESRTHGARELPGDPELIQVACNLVRHGDLRG